jgi:hypothetical protein
MFFLAFKIELHENGGIPRSFNQLKDNQKTKQNKTK